MSGTGGGIDSGSGDLSEQLVDSINASYGTHPGHRAAHAKGVLCSALFEPTADAAALCRAPHFAAPAPTRVRFSNGSGDPTASDGVRDGRGMAVKFSLSGGGTTDIVSVSLPCFFVRTPDDLLAFNEARRAGLEAVGAFLSEHPETVPAVTAALSLPVPVSYATVAYRALHAFGFEDGEGTLRWGRYDWEPEAGEQGVDDDEAASWPPDHLQRELVSRLGEGPVGFRLRVSLAAEGDPLDDPTAQWPGDREVVEVGRLAVTGIATDRERDGDVLVFDPTRLTDGILLSGDPILLARPGAYSVSVSRRS